jgi:hypothetical protein
MLTFSDLCDVGRAVGKGQRTATGNPNCSYPMRRIIFTTCEFHSQRKASLPSFLGCINWLAAFMFDE